MDKTPDRICGGLNCDDVVRWTRSGWRHRKLTKDNRDHPALPGELVSDE